MRPSKLSKLAIQINAVLAVSCYSLAAQAATIDIPNRPLAGVALSYAPNLVLALSVEFPTGGAAYTTVGGQQKGIIKPEFLDNQYRGYFDPKKCYRYTGQHFEPISIAGPRNTCSGNDDFNGSIMNYLTASALDVFRQVMTGGNRAYGPNKDNKAYLDGDKVDETFLRRSYKQHSSMQWRFIELNGLSEGRIRDFFPDHYVNMMPDIKARKFGPASKGMPKAYGFARVDGKPLTDQDYFYDTKLYFSSEDFGAHALRSVQASDGSNPDVILPKINMDYKAIVVKVCDPKFLEENCVAYGNNYKPEGLLQKYGRDGMRVAALGYLNDDTYAADAPVLRSRMKYLIDKENKGKAGGEEWNKTTGQFYVNPDPRDASASRVANSGVINYLNKFGDVSGYKTYDIGGELYYAALRYLRNGQSVYRRTNLDDKLKDGFPAIYDWEDPLTDGFAGGVKDKEALCRSSNIMYIGDTNTHNDWNLPNFSNVKYKDYGNTKVPGNPPSDVIETKTYLQALLQNEGLGASTWDQNRGSSHSPAGIAGLAYWARTHDLRPDIDGDQFGNNYMIDVVEYGNFKGQNNPYWLAAKYGGFDLAKASDFNFNGTTYKMPIQRDSWTDDPAGTSSIAGFFGSSSIVGIPRNFGVANNPDNMVDSLKKAFATIGSFKDPSQAAPGLTGRSGEVIDLAKGTNLLAASFNLGDLSGDIRVISFSSKDGKDETKELWRVSTELQQSYHGSTNAWQQRNVYTTQNSAKKLFKNASLSTQKPADSQSLVNYVLGDKSEEGNKWRKRTNIMGTVINSSPITILPPDKELKLKCRYNATAESRETYYAAAANDGMLHIFNANTRKEVLAYIPSTALPKLEDMAIPNATHQFLNDGLITYADVCIGNQARSVVLGSAGRGGASLYALDVTDLSSAGQNNIMWEFSNADDPDLGLTISKSSIVNNGNGEPIVILSSGYNNASGRGSLFILNINNSGRWSSSNYQKIHLGNSGVGTPFVYDEDKDGIPERVYVGDYDGNVWRIDYDKTSNKWAVGYGGRPMFTTDSKAPITGAPFAQKIGGKIYVVIGTGQYLNSDGTTDATQNYAYGLIDDPNNTTTISNSALLEQTIKSRAATYNTEPPRTLWHVSKNPFIEGTHRGWRLKLMPGQAIAANSLIRSETLAEFVAVRRTGNDTSAVGENACMISGSTSIISVDLLNGGEYEKAVFDTDDDQIVNEKDDHGSMMEMQGMVSPEAQVVQTTSGDQKTSTYLTVDQKTGKIVKNIVADFPKGKGAPTLIRVNLREIPL